MPKIENSFLSSALTNVLETHPRIKRLTAAIDMEHITSFDGPIIKELDRSMTSYLSSDKKLLEEWKVTAETLHSALDWAYPTDAKVVAAMILAGGAIVLPGLTLRSDLSSTIKKARAVYQKNLASKIGPNKPGSVVYDFLDTDKQSIVTILVETFKSLNIQAEKDKKLFEALNELLTNQEKPLRVGKDFHKLDIAALDTAVRERFRTGYHAKAVRQWIGDDKSESRDTHSHNKSTLKLLNFQCLKLQEDSHDEIFWVGFHYSIKNLEEVYKILDDAINNNALADLNLDIEWHVKAWRSNLYKSVNENTKKEDLNLNVDIGTASIFNGFGPWTANLICIEDDNDEYEALENKINVVGNCAEVIGQGARTVASVSGPTPMGAAAAAVASVAGFVDLCCDITAAIVEIVNFFDKNDTIGFVNITGLGDYAEDMPVEAQPHVLNPLSKTAGSKNRGGAYEIFTQETLSGASDFKRSWRYRQEYALSNPVHKDPLGYIGGKGDEPTKIYLLYPADKLIGSDVNHTPSGKDAHADWIGDPQLQENRKVVMGTVHWGVRGSNAIDYTPWVMAARFTKPEEEHFSIK